DGAARLVIIDVAVDVADEFVAGLRPGTDAGLVGHGAGRHEQGGLLAEQRGDPLLQAVYGRVLAEGVRADLRGGPGRPAARRPGEGVAAQLDQFRHDGAPRFVVCAV